jgi:translocation and assembly module TamB
LRGLLPQAAIDAQFTATALKLPSLFSAQTMNARISIAAAAPGSTSTDFSSRTVMAEVDASQLAVPAGTFATARAKVDGTLAQHTIVLALKSEDLDVTASAHGGLRDVKARDMAALAWSGSLDALENRGPWPLRLVSPATLALSQKEARIGELQASIATARSMSPTSCGNDGRISSHGRFAAVPLASAARLAGVKLPFVSTLKVGGDWSLAASPRLNGTVRVEREEGDVWVRGDGPADARGVALGISSAALNASLRDDALDAVGTFRSARGGSVDLKGTIGMIASASRGQIARNAPLTLTVTADLPTLQLLQPWIGTTAAIDGRARADISARGTLDRPILTGTINGENLRIEAPQYGLHFRDGRLAAHLEERRIVLDELRFVAGNGDFRATGTLVTATDKGVTPEARLTWQANDFRLLNRPDLRLVVDGEGTLTTADGKLSLIGKLKADEGRVVYVSPKAPLGDDVIVKGWQRPTKATWRTANLPLAIDLTLDLGDKLTFSGEGLETDLRGVVRVTTASGGGFVGKGSIRAVNGTYFAFSQKLVIDRGQLLFDGPLDNPRWTSWPCARTWRSKQALQ